MRRLAICWTAALVCWAGASGAQAASAPGRVTVGFPSSSPIQFPAWAMLALPDGSLLVAGSSAPDPGAGIEGGQPGFAELRRDGSLNPGFGAGGLAQPALPEHFDPLQILQQADGALLVVGGSSSSCICSLPELAILRLLPNGMPDPTYGTGGYAHLHGLQEPRASGALAALQPDGELVVAALSGRTPGASAAVARLTPAGTLDPNFGVRGVATLTSLQAAYDVGVLTSGEIEVLGAAASSAATPSSTLLRLSVVGNPDLSYPQIASPLAVQPHMLLAPDGSALLVGAIAGSSAPRLDRFAPDGVRVSSLLLGPAKSLPGLLALSNGDAALIEHPQAGQVQITHLPPSGAGGTPVSIVPAFGGGRLGAGSAAKLDGNGFDGALVVQRPDGSFASAGGVTLRVQGLRGERSTLTEFGVFSLDPGLRPDRSFGATGVRFKLSGAPLSRKLAAVRKANAMLVGLTASDAALAQVTLHAAGRTIGAAGSALQVPGRAERVAVHLNALGRRLAHSRHALRVRVDVRAADLAANRASSRASATLR